MGKILGQQIVVGVTGSFGSGCTTVTEVLADEFGFTQYSLSKFNV